MKNSLVSINKVSVFQGDTAMKTKNITAISIGLMLFTMSFMMIKMSPAKQPPMFSHDRSNLSVLPIGTIVMWPGDETTIPYGWRFCDGFNGTPDLRDRFVLGGEMLGEKGGSNDMQLKVSNIPKHNHNFKTSTDGLHSHLLEDHTRPFILYFFEFSTQSFEFSLPPLWCEIDYVEKSGMHNHTGYTDYAVGGSSVPFDNRPDCIRVAFIMRVQ